jgi:hypothetical protein
MITDQDNYIPPSAFSNPEYKWDLWK